MNYKKIYSSYYNMFSLSHNSEGYEFCSRKNKPFIAGNIEPDCVTIVAQHEKGGIAVIKQFRPTINQMIYELPAGKIDEGELPIEAAERELKEETGLTMIGNPTIRPFAFPSVGITDESHVIVWCKCIGKISTKHLQPRENIEPQIMEIMELLNLFDDPYICIDAKLAMLMLGLQLELLII